MRGRRRERRESGREEDNERGEEESGRGEEKVGKRWVKKRVGESKGGKKEE